MACMLVIERLVCECVNDALIGLVNTASQVVTPDNLYSGTGKMPFSICVARQFSYYVMHDLYHISYKQIAHRSGFNVRNVIRNAGKARDLSHNDKVYRAVKTLIDVKI